MDEEIIITGAVTIVCLLAVCLKRRRQRNRRRMWVNPYLQRRRFGGRYDDVRKVIATFVLNVNLFHKTNINSFQYFDLQRFPNTFRENFHMTEAHFEDIYQKIKPHLLPKKRSRPDMIPPRAKLAMVLE